MGLLDWAEEKIHRLNIWDFAMVKVALVVFGMIIGAYLAGFVKEYVWYFGAVFVLLYVIILYRVFR